MYSFGKEIKDLKEAENVFVELIEKGIFDKFLESAKIDKDFLIEKIEVAECYTLGIDYDIFLDDIFDTITQKEVIDEIKKREGNSRNSLIVGDCSIQLENSDDDLICYFICSDVYSKNNTDKMLLLSVGFILEDTNGTKQFVIL